jgi:hypothetical protein
MAVRNGLTSAWGACLQYDSPKKRKFPSCSDSLTDGQRQDVIRWKNELGQLRAQRQYDVAARVEDWLLEAEKVLARRETQPPA